MYNPEEIQDRKDELRQAVLQARAFRPLYVRMKIFYGCNLKCEMCKHWRATHEPPMSSDRFGELLSEPAELGTWKIHVSGEEPMLRPQVPGIAAQASTMVIKVTMTTNGALVDKVSAKPKRQGTG